MYRATLTRSLTSIGLTQPQGDPGGAYVSGSMHITVVQSSLGGGGGSAKGGEDGRVAFFLAEELNGDDVGGGMGIKNCLDTIAGDGACAELHVVVDGMGECIGAIENPWGL